MTTSEEIETNHKDRVTCLDINYDGTKILTGSIDHRINIWSVSPRTQERTLVDTWTAHDADIRDAKWLHPSTGTHLGTVGNDLKFNLWGEETSQAPNSGRRFKKLCFISSPTRVPFVSLDFRNIDSVYTYLAMIDRQGLLSIYEPTNPDDFKDWTLIDRWNVMVPVPGRGQQTSFKVRWDQNVMPLPYVCGISDDRRQLSLVVTAGNEVKIYRGIAADDHRAGHNAPAPPAPDSEASHRITFYEAARLPAHPGLIRDVQWAPFNIRGTDLFATACRDGAVRVYEMSVTEPRDSSSHAAITANKTSSAQRDPNTSTASSSTATTPSKTPYGPKQTQSSNLTSAITGRSSTQQQQQQQQTSTSTPTQAQTSSSSSTTTSPSTTVHPRTTYPFPYAHNVICVADLGHAHDDAWSVSWDPNGQVLVSGGADGATKIWRRSVLDLDGLGIDENGANGKGSSTTTAAATGNGKRGNGGAGVGGGKWLLFADQAIGSHRDGSEDGEDD